MGTIYLGALLVQLAVSTVTIQQPFYIYFERSGGFTGIVNAVEIQSDSLQQEEFEQLKNLIDHSNFFETETRNSLKENMPDQFQYKITIDYDNRRQTLEFGDVSVPESLRLLIQYLSKKARPVKK